jgi:hypothetical protein
LHCICTERPENLFVGESGFIRYIDSGAAQTQEENPRVAYPSKACMPDCIGDIHQKRIDYG